jgi:hypothetical protein
VDCIAKLFLLLPESRDETADLLVPLLHILYMLVDIDMNHGE